MNLQEELKELKQRIAELEQKAKQEQGFPQDGDIYWLINNAGKTNWVHWHDTEIDNKRLLFGNAFKTKDESEFQVEKTKVEAELRKFSRPFEVYSKNYSILWSDYEKDIEIDWIFGIVRQGTIYFESEEKAKQAIESIGVDRIKKYLFGVED